MSPWPRSTGWRSSSRTERTEVSLGATPTRTTLLEVRLRAVRPGRWQLGPARAVQGRDTVEAEALVVDVTANRAALASTLNPRLRRLLERARPPEVGGAAVNLIVSAESASVGEQVDVVTAAWFPRDLRLQLRRPPTLQPPVIDAVWTYPQATPAGIAATRNVGGRWYDLFVAHQVVFPLVPGTVTIPRATLKYSTPVALQFFSQEERFALTSRAETLTVRPLPDAGRPADFSGAVASGLTHRSAHHSAGGKGRARESPSSLRSRARAILRSGRRRRCPGRPGHAPTSIGWRSRSLRREGRVGGTKIVPLPCGPRLGGSAGAARGELCLLRSGGAPVHQSCVAGRVRPPSPRHPRRAASAALPPALISGSGEGLARRLVGRCTRLALACASSGSHRHCSRSGEAVPTRRSRGPPRPSPISAPPSRSSTRCLAPWCPIPTIARAQGSRRCSPAAGADAELARTGRRRSRSGCWRGGMGRQRPRAEDPRPRRRGQKLVLRLGGSLVAGRGRGAASSCSRWRAPGLSTPRLLRPRSCTRRALSRGRGGIRAARRRRARCRRPLVQSRGRVSIGSATAGTRRGRVARGPGASTPRARLR